MQDPDKADTEAFGSSERAGGQVWAASIVARRAHPAGGWQLTQQALIFGATSRADAESYAMLRAAEIHPDAVERHVSVTMAIGVHWDE